MEEKQKTLQQEFEQLLESGKKLDIGAAKVFLNKILQQSGKNI